MRPRRPRPSLAWKWAALLLLAAPAVARATTFRKEATLVDLLSQSELILQGRVSELTDGIDERGVPYTEVTLRVADAIKGASGPEYRFRQFGLLKPRRMPDGRVNLMVTPAAFPKYVKGENTILFLGKAAAWTGLRTTAGLGQGKFNVSVAGAVNGVNNAGLFRGVRVEPALLSERERRVVRTGEGAVNARAFVALVKHAVNEKWIESKRMSHEQK